jgi:hypothetical protein
MKPESWRRLDMRKIILIIGVFFIFGCVTPAKRTEFICVADVGKNSECKIVPCSEVSAICKTGKYRILKNYITGYAYVYSTDPLTDMKRCREAAR